VQHPSWFGRSGVSVLCLRGFSLCHAGFSKRRATARPDEPPTPGPGQLAALIRYRSPTAVAYPPQCAGMDTRELLAVSLRNPRVSASFEPGAMTCPISMASTRSRCRDGVGSINSGTPSRCAVPATAATCPCGVGPRRSVGRVRRRSGSRAAQTVMNRFSTAVPVHRAVVPDAVENRKRQRGSHDKMPDERLV
jgi:hypothetical protein